MKHVAGKVVPFNYTQFPEGWNIYNKKLPSSIVNGMDAKEAAFSPSFLELDDHGNLYFAEPELNRIYTITPEGVIHPWDPETVEKIKAIGGPNALNVDADFRMKVQPDGSMYFWTGTKWFRVAKKNQTPGEVIVPGASGAFAYKFDGATGRHLQTLNGKNGKLTVEYLYDDKGRLVGLKDELGKEIVIDRDASGTPIAIIAPTGERTQLTVVDGTLRAVENPLKQT